MKIQARSVVLSVLLLFCVGFLGLAPQGCKSFQQTSYKTSGAAVLSVEAAMTLWKTYVDSGKATPEQQDKVRGAYGKYQKSMNLLIDLAEAGVKTNDTSSLQNTITLVMNAQADLVSVIKAFVQSQ